MNRRAVLVVIVGSLLLIASTKGNSLVNESTLVKIIGSEASR